MPLHDTKCTSCGHTEEIFFQPAHRPKQIRCSQCNRISKILPGKPLIDMQNRPIEKQLEREASDGLF
jgi:hypothetical protein